MSRPSATRATAEPSTKMSSGRPTPEPDNLYQIPGPEPAAPEPVAPEREYRVGDEVDDDHTAVERRHEDRRPTPNAPATRPRYRKITKASAHATAGPGCCSPLGPTLIPMPTIVQAAGKSLADG